MAYALQDGPGGGGNSIEVIKPCGEAWHHMKGMLFPFDLGRWFTLGFVAWLAMLARAKLNFSFRFRSGPWGGEAPPGPSTESVKEALQQASRFVEDNLFLIVVVAAVAAILLVAVHLVLTYLGSRGVFMYLDCTARRQAAVVEPWRRARKHAWSLCLLRVLVDVCGGAIGLAILGLALLAVWPDVKQMKLEPGSLATLILCGALLLTVTIVLGTARWLLTNLLATMMYVRDWSAMEALKELGALARGRLGAFILYLLMNVALWLAYAVVAVPLTCCTCCIGGLPVVHQTILQPLFLWIRAYPFYFLAQFGDAYAIPAEPAPQWARRDRRYPNIVSCPHCGQEHQIPGSAAGTYACVKCSAQFEVQ